MVNFSEKMTSILAWWEGLPRTIDLPEASEIDPFALKPWLGDLGIVERVGNPARFRIRLVGVNLRIIDGMDVTGRYLDDVCPPPILDQVIEPYRLCLARRRPVHARLVEHDRPHYCIDRLLLPFGQHIDRILVHMLRTEDANMPELAPLMIQQRADAVSTVL